MSNTVSEIEAATQRFYAAVEHATLGNGVQAISDCWHHTDYVTSVHPSGEWARGWEEVHATWAILASFGAPQRGGSRMHSLNVNLVHGDMAYITCVFLSAPTFGSVELACTNVLQRLAGEWKIVHHHIDKSPVVAAAFERIALGG